MTAPLCRYQEDAVSFFHQAQVDCGLAGGRGALDRAGFDIAAALKLQRKVAIPQPPVGLVGTEVVAIGAREHRSRLIPG